MGRLLMVMMMMMVVVMVVVVVVVMMMLMMMMMKMRMNIMTYGIFGHPRVLKSKRLGYGGGGGGGQSPTTPSWNEFLPTKGDFTNKHGENR